MSAHISNTNECPNCRATVAAGATRCACGQSFEAQAHEHRPSSNLVAQAEALYETHLRARLQRAQRTLKLAKVDLLRDPVNPVRKAQLREAEKELRQIQTQVEVQASRVADAIATATRGQAQWQLTPETPNAFRAAQAAKAEQSLEFVRAQIAVEVPRAAAVTGQFSVTQAAKAQAIEPSATSSCPACGETVAMGANRCQCGHQMLAEHDGAPDFISAEEFAALRGS